MTTYQVHLVNKKHNLDVTFPVDADTSILDAAAFQGID